MGSSIDYRRNCAGCGAVGLVGVGHRNQQWTIAKSRYQIIVLLVALGEDRIECVERCRSASTTVQKLLRETKEIHNDADPVFKRGCPLEMNV